MYVSSNRLRYTDILWAPTNQARVEVYAFAPFRKHRGAVKDTAKFKCNILAEQISMPERMPFSAFRTCMFTERRLKT